jgi:hypothetical protein
MNSDRAVGFGLIALAILVFLIGFGACSGSGEEYYHVPGVSVDVDVDKRKGVKPAPRVKPAPKAPSFRKR